MNFQMKFALKSVVNQLQILSKASLATTNHPRTTAIMKLLKQSEAIKIDEELFSTYKYSVHQLMELAGLSCAHAIAKCYPLGPVKDETTRRVLVVCGPGNNGGDGLVAARHLALMGYCCDIYYPKRTDNELYQNLLLQCQSFNDAIRIIDTCPSNDAAVDNNAYRLIVDALFGFSFRPPVRELFVPIMNFLSKSTVPITSIDIPSGWDVENGPAEENNSIAPDLLISLTAPKICAKYFKGRFHFLGGRFVPPQLQDKYELNLIDYVGTETCVEIPRD